MNIQFLHRLEHFLLPCSLYRVLVGAVVPFGSQPICNATGIESENYIGWHPYDQRPETAHWNSRVRVLSVGASPTPAPVREYVADFDRRLFLIVRLIHTPLIDHYENPPYRPRDPSLS